MIDWQSLLETLTLSTVAVAGIAWVGRAIGTHILDLDLERFRKQAASDLEKTRADWTALTNERHTRFTHLAERQAEVIAEVFGRLELLHLSSRRWAALLKPASASMAKERGEVAKAFQTFVDYYYPHSIWLDRATCDQINDIVDILNSAFTDLSLDLDEQGFPKDSAAMKAAYEKVNIRIPAARLLLEERLRRILGIADVGTTIAAPKR